MEIFHWKLTTLKLILKSWGFISKVQLWTFEIFFVNSESPFNSSQNSAKILILSVINVWIWALELSHLLKSRNFSKIAKCTPQPTSLPPPRPSASGGLRSIGWSFLYSTTRNKFAKEILSKIEKLKGRVRFDMEWASLPIFCCIAIFWNIEIEVLSKNWAK